MTFPQKTHQKPGSSPRHRALLQVSVLPRFLPSGKKEGHSHSLTGRLRQHRPRAPIQSPAYLLFLLLLFLLGNLGCLVLPHQLREVSHVLVCLLQEIGQALVLLLVDEFPVPFLIFCLQKRAVTAFACKICLSISNQDRQIRVEKSTGDYC